MDKEIRKKILTTVEIINDCQGKEEKDVIEKLVIQGMKELEAEILLSFVPLAFGRVVIEKLVERSKGSKICLSETVDILYEKNESYLPLKLKNEPNYIEAYEMAKETFLTGIIPREKFKNVANYSAEVNAVNNALNAGEKLDGGTMHPPVLMRLGQIEGFENWYKRICFQQNNKYNQPVKPWWQFWS